MKMAVSCTSILGLLTVLILGCENTENPIGKETPKSPTNPLAPVDVRNSGELALPRSYLAKRGRSTTAD